MLLLDRGDVAALLSLPDCIAAVEQVFRRHALGQLPVAPGVLGAHLGRGGFHVKTAAIGGTPGYFAAKVNANFPENPVALGLPAIQGVVALFDADSGRPLALLDSGEITVLRTAAASAVAARHLARAESATVTIVGCGLQGRSHLRALAQVLPLRRAFALDLDPSRASRFAEELGPGLGIAITPSDDLAGAIAESDVCVTCTPARRPVFPAALLRPGLFIAAVGADSPGKQELEPAVLQRSRVVVDVLEQAAAFGELHHAIAEGLLSASDVYATLGQVIAGLRPGRTSAAEVFVFDSTGTALQDVVAAALVFERARGAGRGTSVELAP
jgi:ornithine cyclodeaminase/alanine dehydrogenase-like protein (mu-crystallin family)